MSDEVNKEMLPDSHESRFSFYLHKFKSDLNLTKVKHTSLCFGGQACSVNFHDNTLELHSFHPNHERKVVLQNVEKFLFKSASECSSDYVEFCTVAVNFSITLYKWTLTGNSQLDVLAQETLQSCLNGENNESTTVDHAELLLYEDQVIAAVINRIIVLRLTLKDGVLKTTSSLCLSASSLHIERVQIIQDLCVSLNLVAEKKLLFYNLENGQKILELDLSGCSIDENAVQKWKISQDLKTLAIIHHTGDLFLLDLVKYSAKNPNALKWFGKSSGTGEQTLFSYLDTCQYGEFSWREKLISLHSKKETVVTQRSYLQSSSKPKAHKVFRKGQRSKVTGFQQKEHRRASVVSSEMTPVIKVPVSLRGYSVDDLHLDPKVVTLVYMYNDTQVLAQWLITHGKWTTFSLQPGERVILLTSPSVPHVVLTGGSLNCVVTDPTLDQEKFVNELMVYGGAAFAESVCRLNKWGQCSIPIHTLEVGLKHRQLDTVTYFLKSKENLFTATKHAPDSPHSALDVPLWGTSLSHHDNLLQLEPAVSLLLGSARDCAEDKFAQVFGKQLLDITVDFLYGLLLNGLAVLEQASEPADKTDLQNTTDKLLQYIEEARVCVRLMEERVSLSRAGSVSAGSVSVVSSEVDTTDGPVSPWDSMDIETVIEDGIMKNKIPKLQQYLLQRGEHSRADYSAVKAVGTAGAINYIKFGQMEKAKELLAKLGLNELNKLWEIALYTPDTTLCNSIIEELLSKEALSEDQVAMVTFLKELNQLYPCRNFEKLKCLHHHVKDSETHDIHRLKTLTNPTPLYELTEECGNLTACSQEELRETTPYSEVLLQWVGEWDHKTRDLIKLDVLLHTPGSALDKFNKEVIWEYLLSNNMADVTVAWIHNSFHGNTQEEVTWPVSHLGNVPVEFVNSVTMCTPRVQRAILKAFASHGIFTDEALSSFESLLSQLNSVGGTLQLPHPLSRFHPLSVEQFHVEMIQYCLQHNLPYFLWIYCSLHRLVPELLQGINEGEMPGFWLALFNQFYNITTGNGNYKEAVYQSSVTNAVAVWSQGASCVGEMLQGGHVLAALATLMFSPYSLQQVTFVTQQMEAFDGLSSEVVESAIHDYPKLHSTLFPASVTESPHADVSVYQLLIGNSPFDPRRLFGWQPTNSCVGEDAVKEMPFFSNTELAASYGYSEQLRYTYYLKQGRPSFAFVTFLAEEFKNGGPTIPSKRLSIAKGTSIWIGVKHFTQAGIASSCVMFQELLGHDSLLLRTYIQVGLEILAHRNNAVTGTMDRRREQIKKNEEEIVGMLLDCVQNGVRCAPTVLHALEAAILAGVSKDRISMPSFESGQCWTVAVVFCHLMRLPYTTVFLESCAQSNQWLPFLWFSQLHQYPKEQLSNLLHYFKSGHLQEHLRYILANADLWSSRENSKHVLAKQRSDLAAKEVRSRMYQKIGMVKKNESDDTSSSGDEEPGLSSVQQDQDKEEDTDLQVTYEGAPGDVFGVMFAAQASKCPWKSLLAYAIVLRNPLFSELAACYEKAGPLPCLCCWLVAMMDATEHAHFLENHGKSPWRYTMATLDAILDVFVKQKWGSVLVTGFDIFQKDSPLLPFLQFYADFTEKKSYNNYLDVFKEAVFQFHHDSSGRSANIIGSSQWLERTTYRIIQFMLTSTPSLYEVAQLLKILDSESITLVFKDVDPDFRKQYRLVQCVQAGEVETVHLPALLTQTSDQHEAECCSVLQQLIDRQRYVEARTFAEVSGVKSVQVTIQQLKQYKAKISGTDLWSSTTARLKFYKDCMERCQRHAVPADHMLDFFQSEAEASDSAAERAELYGMCLQTLRGDANNESASKMATETYHKMWKNKIQEKIQNMEEMPGLSVEEDIFTDLDVAGKSRSAPMKKEQLCFGKMPRNTDKPKDLTEKEICALQKLMGDLLRQGEITECCRVATEFNMYSQDLAIILSCIRLSMGSYQLEHLGPDMLHLLRTLPGEAHRQSIAAPVALLRNSSSISLISNIQPMVDSASEENEEKIAAMERLLNHCDVGKQTCVRVLTAFKISTVLDIGYEDVISGDDYNILRSLLKTNCSAKFRLASDFLGTSALSPEEVAGFLSDAILQSYKLSLGDTAGNQEMFFDPGRNFSDFHQIVRLCQEPSLLGGRLLDATAAMATSEEEMTSTILTLQTEMLILAHECYTAACDMEGISNILRAARILTIHLATGSEYQLMTRLLTGVGRFNEMTYIFDALQESHQFELLLGKGMEKEDKLKTAILDYLKRYHPSDTDTYTMVALKFMMYREIAQLLEDNARKLLAKFKGKQLENNSDTQTALQKVAQYYAEAAESYVKDNCLRHAQTCIRQARLVALQVKYLPSNQQFINLTTKGANSIISNHPVFTEAYIISEAYQKKDNWALALCNNVIARGDMKYLQEFRAHIRVTTQLIEDSIDKYQQVGDKSPQSLSHIKKLLQLCKDVKVQYRLAKQLGLRDLIMTLEKGDSRSYIQDFASSIA